MLLYRLAFIISLLACFVINGRLVEVPQHYVTYFAASSAWLLIIISRRSIIKENK